MKNLLIVLGISVVLVFGIIFLTSKKEETKVKSYEVMTSREAALLCTTDMATEFHIHPELKIVVDGEEIILPEDIGITSTCMNSIHTHTDLPIIHVESPVQKDFTLGDFFAVWDKPFDSMHVADFAADTAGQVRVSINGVEVDTYENTIFYDKDKIVIEAQSVASI